jgi:hypothetical protein
MCIYVKKKESVGKILNTKPTMLYISYRIQKNREEGGEQNTGRERQKRRKKAERGDTTYGMSHTKKPSLLCFFFLVRSLFIGK